MFIGGGMAQELYTTMLKHQTYNFLFYYILMSFQLELTKWEQAENSTSHYYYNTIQNCYGLFLKIFRKIN
jgi:hypothetical protein